MTRVAMHREPAATPHPALRLSHTIFPRNTQRHIRLHAPAAQHTSLHPQHSLVCNLTAHTLLIARPYSIRAESILQYCA